MLDMQKIAIEQKFESTELLLNDDATRDKVSEAIKNAAKNLKNGDILLLTYSGHGAYFKDEEELEPLINGERNNQAWCLYDGFMIDDELHYFWTFFEEGVRIFMISDSCHSGTMNMDPWQFGIVIEKGILKNEANEIYLKRQKYYDEIKVRAAERHKRSFESTVLLISGCQDDESSHILAPYENSLLTKVINEVWDNGNYKGETYDDFFEEVRVKVKRIAANDAQRQQNPNISVIGKVNHEFREQRPFTV